MTDEKHWYSPLGSLILGTLEKLTGRAEIEDINPDGTPVYSGGTEIFYDDQETIYSKNGYPLYLCVDGEEWIFPDLLHLTEAEHATHMETLKA